MCVSFMGVRQLDEYILVMKRNKTPDTVVLLDIVKGRDKFGQYFRREDHSLICCSFPGVVQYGCSQTEMKVDAKRNVTSSCLLDVKLDWVL